MDGSSLEVTARTMGVRYMSDIEEELRKELDSCNRDYKRLAEEASVCSKDRDDYKQIAWDQELLLKEIQEYNIEMLYALEIAWGVIGTAGHCIGTEDQEDWLRAANRWRDRYNKVVEKP